MHLFLLIALIVFCGLAVLLRDLLKAAICLAVASIFLALIFFRLNGPYVGVFEISVVAGLITVLFITAITLTRAEGGVHEARWPLWLFPLFFVALLLADVAVMHKLFSQLPALNQSTAGTFGEVLWNRRTFDLIGQVGVIFAGVFAVLALFRKGGTHE